ncbi:uncharacterized lipoprotein YddW (UPF0748 family) [Melghirimyces profundicolus]|uniref:Uncharacterized lipoprotein YddW (UPF0748 family) n=1 Tax=Melghirimyces profundicolus TaxID=1242148 RepID=A0A2T6BG51_9BACL|nr:family 10 glycosylhydrolase [Melghirimyces profundicolus]PTX55026.1 uncharacterized lipoprotein YddW (UPF0748 family) [Melghirimyces profundicolus]
MKRIVGLLTVVLLAVGWLPVGMPVTVRAEEAPKEEFRAFWVDAFHEGFKTPEQVDRLMEDVRRAGANAVIVQVRRRGDAYFNKALEPRTQDPGLQSGFDALAYLLEKAHNESPRIEVHAWLATLPIWNSATPPESPDHVFNRHGPTAEERDYWLMESVDGADRFGADYVLDPGHPDALDYTVDQYVNVVKEYPVDGIHLDLVRYMGPEWGYNPVSLERYQKETGAVGRPDPQDEGWKEWRREQVDHLMRKVYLKSIAIRPDIKVSAAVIAWGKGPETMEEYRNSAPVQRVMQDWNGWLQEGIIDLAVPMNYDREHVADQKAWYDQWIHWEKDHQYQRQIAAGPGIFLNSIEGSLAQIARAQAPSAEGNRLAGVSLYSYAVTNKDGVDREVFLQALKEPTSYGEPGFHDVARPPEMKWKTRPSKGFLMGQTVDREGRPLDGAEVELRHRSHRYLVKTDGSGFFGKAELPPGRYTVKVKKGKGPAETIRIRAGRVSRVEVEAK